MGVGGVGVDSVGVDSVGVDGFVWVLVCGC